MASNTNQYTNNKKNDPYTILGVSHTATPQEIRTAYKKAALQYHPDKVNHQNDFERIQAHEQFTKINTAYEILSNPQQKYVYDIQQQQQRHNHMSSNDDDNNHRVFISPILRRYSTRATPSSRNDSDINIDDDMWNNDNNPSTNPFHFFDKVFREEFGSDIFGPQDPYSKSSRRFPTPNHTNIWEQMIQEQHDMIKRMQEEMNQSQSQTNNNNNNQGGIFSSIINRHKTKQPNHQHHFTSSSSSTRIMKNAKGETIKTTERTIQQNGLPPQTIQEIIITNPDGTIKEKKQRTLRHDDDDTNHTTVQQLPFWNSIFGNDHHKEDQVSSQQQQQQQLPNHQNRNDNTDQNNNNNYGWNGISNMISSWFGNHPNNNNNNHTTNNKKQDTSSTPRPREDTP